MSFLHKQGKYITGIDLQKATASRPGGHDKGIRNAFASQTLEAQADQQGRGTIVWGPERRLHSY